MAADDYYQYKPLESDRHIRLLKFHRGIGPRWKGWKRQGPLFSLVHVALDDVPDFEAVSYAWGSAMQVEKLPTAHGGFIPITKSVFEAMPFLLDESKTAFLWIDQVCINQDDPDEKGHQVALMNQVYRFATRTLIWLGTEDLETRTAVELLEYLEEWEDQSQTIFDWIHDALRDPQGQHLVAKSGGNNRAAISIIENLLSRPWFTRGWVVQEFALSDDPVFVIGRCKLGWEAIRTLCQAIYYKNITNPYILHRLLSLRDAQMSLRAFTKVESDNTRASMFCRLLMYNCDAFTTKDYRDRIYAYMGIWLPPGFEIDYRQTVGETYIGFTRHLIDELRFLDIIGAGHSLETLPSGDLRGLPSWVPDFSGNTRLESLIWHTAATRSITWNASASRPYQKVPGASPLEVRAVGRLIGTATTVAHMSGTGSAYELLDTYNELSNMEGGFMSRSEFLKIMNDAQTNGIWSERFSFEDLISYCEAYWNHGRSLGEEYLASVANPGPYENLRNIDIFLQDVAKMFGDWCFVRTSGGNFCMAPPLTAPGNVIVILHGCSVPHILRKTDDPERYQMVGECYLQGAMNGKAVTWAEDEADLFILV